MSRRYIAIFFIAAATLLLEVSLTRVFSVIFFSNYAFLIVSSALFGYGISSVWLSLRENAHKEHTEKLLILSAFLFAASILFLLIIICFFPFNFQETNSLQNVMYFFIYYMAVVLPFIFSGAFVSFLFMRYSDKSNTLYFWDLVGASLGSLLVFILIRKVGGDGLFWVCIVLVLSSIVLFAKSNLVKLVSIICIIAVVFVSFTYKSRFEIKPHIAKRIFTFYQETGKIVYTTWSALTRIDVAKNWPNWIIWIDCGTNQSYMPIMEKDKLKSDKKFQHYVVPAYLMPYFLRKGATTLIIGFGGGVELYYALDAGASRIIGVEMDPAITDIIMKKYKEETGFVFFNDKIKIINNEGRSFLKSYKGKFDIIQEVHNSTPIAIASGALNISETFLMTKEAFNDYLDKLSDDGILSLYRDGVERIFSIAVNVLSDRNIHDAYRHLAVISMLDNPGRMDLIMLKKSPFNQEEINTIKRITEERGWKIFYLPDNPSQYPHFWPDLLSKSGIEEIEKRTGVILDPPTDSKPFFKTWLPLWRFNIKDPGYFAPEERELIESTSHKIQYILLTILIEGAILALFFIFIPLIKFSKLKMLASNKSVVGYFCGLGFGFILLEIVYMQKFILYLGHPSYSITFILFSLLLSAGTGSYISGHLAKTRNFQKILRIVFPVIIIIILGSIIFLKMLMESTIQYPSSVKFVISFVLICILGVFLGMPFPAGINTMGKKEKALVAWAWGINAYATTLGSVFSLIIAVTFGFNVVMLVAAGCYLISFLSMPSMMKNTG